MDRGRGESVDQMATRAQPPVAGLALLVLVTVLYVAVADDNGRPIAGFALPALLVATTRSPRSTAFVGGLSALTAVVVAVVDHGVLQGVELLRLVVMLCAIGLGVAGSARREARERALATVERRSDELWERLHTVSQALRAGRIGTWRWDRATDRVDWDDDLQRLYGLAPGSFPGTFAAWLGLVHPDDRAYSLELVEQARRSGADFNFEHRCVWPDGSVHWLGGVGQAIVDDTGEFTGAVGVTADIDDRKRAEDERRRVHELERRASDRSAYLASASQALASSLDVDQLVDRITAAAVPALADWCRFTLLLDGGEVRVKTAVAHPDPEVVALTRWLETQQPFRPEARFGAAKVIAEGRTQFHPVIHQERIDEIFAGSGVGGVMARLGMRSVITVPVRNPTGVVGALQLVRNVDSPVYTELDVAVAEELATTIGVVVHNAQLFRRQQEARRALDILQELSGHLALAVTVDDVADVAITQGASAVGADAVFVYVGDRDGDALELLRYRGYEDGGQRSSTVPLHRRTPATDALRTDTLVVVESAAEMAARYPELGLRSAAMVAVPLRIRRVHAGALVFGFRRPRTFTDEERTMLATFAARCAGAIERARLYEAQRDASLTLQRRMLPALPPDAPWVETSAHYGPATGGEVGGDWYQVVGIDDHRIAAALGDAVGRGIPAAAAMGQLRGVVTGAASVDPDPGCVVDATDRFARLGGDTTAASLVYVLVDRATGTLRYAVAGHLPAVVVRAGGGIEVLSGGRRPLLGVVDDGADRPSAQTAFDAGDTVLLFSDGLVERRGETIDDGIERLVHVLEQLGPNGSPDDFCHELVARLTADRAIADDVAVLVLRRTT